MTSSGDPTGGGVFLVLTFLLGAFIRTARKNIPLPYTVVLLMIGGLLGILNHFILLGTLGHSITSWINMDAHLMMAAFLPALIFGSAFSVDYHVFIRELPQMLLLAGPALMLNTGLVATFMVFCSSYDWNWYTCLAFGSMMSATDPVAVVALLKELGASKRLNLLIEGESLFNDGTAMVVFIVCKDFMTGTHHSVPETLVFFCRLAFGGPLVGVAVGLCALWWLRAARFDTVTQITVTVSAAYGAFFIAEVTPLHVSGVLAVVALGLTLASSARQYLHEHETVHAFWEMVEHLANTVIFILAGVLVFDKGLLRDSITVHDWGVLLALYVVLHLTRALVTFFFKPVLSKLAYGITNNDMIIISYSGLRGAVGLALALLVAADTAVPEKTRDLFMFHMAGIATLTLLINGTTTGLLIQYLGITKPNIGSRHVFDRAMMFLEHKMRKRMNQLAHNTVYTHADWDIVKAFVPEVFAAVRKQLAAKEKSTTQSQLCARALACLWCSNTQAMDPTPRVTPELELPSTVAVAESYASGEQEEAEATDGKERSQERPQAGSDPLLRKKQDTLKILHATPRTHKREDTDTSIIAQQTSDGYRLTLSFTSARAFLIEARRRFLSLLTCTYWKLFENGFVGDSALRELLRATSVAIDSCSEPLNEWETLQHLFRKGLYNSVLNKLARCYQQFVFGAMTFEYEIAVCFIAAHYEVERTFVHVINDEMVRETVVFESHRMIEQAQAVVQEFNANFEGVATAITTKHMVKILLHEAIDVGKRLLEKGELEEKEFQLIEGCVHSAYDKKYFPVTITQSEQKLLRGIGFLNELDEATFNQLYDAGQVMHFHEGEVLIRQGSLSHGFYFLVRGSVVLQTHDVRSERERIAQQLNLGAVVGALSMLTGQPTLTTALCTSRVTAVYFPRERVWQLLKSRRHPRAPFRQVTQLEQIVCRMVATLLARVQLAEHFAGFAPTAVHELFSDALLLRPSAYYPFKLSGAALLLTGSMAVRRAEAAADGTPAYAYAFDDTTEQPLRKAHSMGFKQLTEGGENLFNPDYNAAAVHQNKAAEAEASGDFEVVCRDFAFLARDAQLVRYFGPGTRVLCLSPEQTQLYEQHQPKLAQFTSMCVRLQKLAHHARRWSQMRTASSTVQSLPKAGSASVTDGAAIVEDIEA